MFAQRHAVSCTRTHANTDICFRSSCPSILQNSWGNSFRCKDMSCLNFAPARTVNARQNFRRPLKTTFDMTTLIFSTGGCPSYPFYSFKRGPWYPVFRENPSREVATKDHSSSNPPKGNPLDLKTKVDVNKVDVKGFPKIQALTKG